MSRFVSASALSFLILVGCVPPPPSPSATPAAVQVPGCAIIAELPKLIEQVRHAYDLGAAGKDDEAINEASAVLKAVGPLKDHVGDDDLGLSEDATYALGFLVILLSAHASVITDTSGPMPRLSERMRYLPPGLSDLDGYWATVQAQAIVPQGPCAAP